MQPHRHFTLTSIAILTCSIGAFDALKESGVDHGLCLVLPATSGDEMAALTHGGNILVQGLALDDAALQKTRARLQALGVYGLATVVKPRSITPLPYAGNLVNLLICDADELGANAPLKDELLRVIEPGGMALIKTAGKWEKIVKPRPAQMDQWTHFDYDAAGTGVSHDKLVAPPTAVQWRMELEPYTGLGGNPASYRPYTGFRLASERAFFALRLGREDEKKKNDPVFIVGRDALNGLPLWKIPTISPGNGTAQEYQFVANDTRVLTYLEPNAHAVALDAATGKVVMTFDAGAKSIARKKLHPAYYMLRATNKVLIECAEDKLYALNANTGELKWVHEEPDGFVCFPRILEKEQRVLLQVVEKDLDRIQGRWANIKTSAILCLDLETGREIWRNAELKDLNFGQLIPSGESIYAFNPAGIGASDAGWDKRGTGSGFVAKLSSVDGKVLWKSEPFKWGYNLIVREHTPFFATPSELNALNSADGALSAFWKSPFNNRCNRTTATDDWIVMGMGNYVNKDGVATVKGISRGGCAQGVVAGNGLLYYTPNTCHCITMLRGHLALSAEGPLRADLADNLRLDKSAFETAADAKPTELSGLIASEWAPQIALGATETAAVKYGDAEFVAVIHEQRVECREHGKRKWSFSAGGRVSQPPSVEQGLCFFGAHDGCMYCLNAAEGTLRWKFLAAPYERNFVSHGQVESSWPVYNAVMHGGMVCGSAGLHPETGGGIHVWGLVPASGEIAWHKILKRSVLLVKAGGKIAPNRVMNSPLQSDGTKLSIVGVSFSVEETDAAINTRIDTESLGDKNRNWGWSLRGAVETFAR